MKSLRDFLNLLVRLIREYLDSIPEEAPEEPTPPAPKPPANPGDLRIGREIVDMEARRDENGNLIVYKLPAGDGGGSHEIAGLNSKYHPEILGKLINAQPAAREAVAAKYIEDYTLKGTGLKLDGGLRPGTLFFVLDTAFNRGPSGAARIVQNALRRLGYSILADGAWGPKTRGALLQADRGEKIIETLRAEREAYEKNTVGYRAQFWTGLVNRWNRVERVALAWNADAKPAPVKPSPDAPIPLPYERDLDRFYGIASPSPSNLAWFRFPPTNHVLYSRKGPQLTDRDADGREEHRCHEMIAERLEAALMEIFETLGEDQYRKEGWYVYSGCFNYRKKRGGSSLSTHSWGIAIDINGAENPFKSGACTFSDRAIDIMEKHGFLSGGRAWGNDYMHFQAAIPTISPGSYYAEHGLPKTVIPA